MRQHEIDEIIDMLNSIRKGVRFFVTITVIGMFFAAIMILGRYL